MRRPKQVLVFLYKKIDNDFLYCIFLRQSGEWQGISGGVEDDESLIDTVKREVLEETGVDIFNIIELSSVSSIPVVDVVGDFIFGSDVYVIPEYSFGVECNGEVQKLFLMNHIKNHFIQMKEQEILLLGLNYKILLDYSSKIFFS